MAAAHLYQPPSASRAAGRRRRIEDDDGEAGGRVVMDKAGVDSWEYIVKIFVGAALIRYIMQVLLPCLYTTGERTKK